MGGLHEASDWSCTDRSGRHHGGCRRRSAERAAARDTAPRPPDAHAGGYVPHDDRDDAWRWDDERDDGNDGGEGRISPDDAEARGEAEGDGRDDDEVCEGE